MWWVTESHEPHMHNNKLRKEAYKCFWTMLFHRGVFSDPRYREKRLESLQRDKHKYVWHRRDLRPKCVLAMVMEWYPNLPGVEYMGHIKWQ